MDKVVEEVEKVKRDWDEAYSKTQDHIKEIGEYGKSGSAREEENRMVIESMYFGYGIMNIVAAEGEERKSRNVKIDVWRAFFSRFGMVETELSMRSFYQADLVAKRFSCATSCTFDMNGQCLLIGWKGTPINSVSVWKFI